MDNPDRPRDLRRPAHDPREFDELMQLSVEAGTLKHPVPYENYVDESFAQGGASRRRSPLLSHDARTGPRFVLV